MDKLGQGVNIRIPFLGQGGHGRFIFIYSLLILLYISRYHINDIQQSRAEESIV